MRVSLKWLREYVDVTLPAEEVARRLTMAGVEVAAIYRIGSSWDGIYVGQVAKLSRHPNADRLQLVEVDYGPGRTKTVVTGATNLRVGDKVPFATVGARLIDGHSAERREVVLKPAKLRGIVSEGMVCSEKELGLSDEHAGIMILDPEAKVGAALAEELGDVILDVDVTPNQVYCMSMLGIAREVAALTGQTVRVPKVEYTPGGAPSAESIGLEIVDPALCPRYSAIVIRGVTIGQSPRWMQERLSAAGLRPINNVVDVTNYVMLEWNQPLHAFDYDKIRGKRIVVRRAGEHEQLTTLDGVARDLSSEMLVIADEAGAVAIAGVMGGADTEVTSETANVLLESANFNPTSIRRTARALRLPSEASRRFERGLPPQQTVPAARRAAQLMQLVAGGEIAPGVADAYPEPASPRQIILETREVARILGMEFSLDEITRVLGSLGYEVARQEGALLVTVPAYRVDVTLPADLIEDLIRIVGYDELPSTMPDGPLPEPAADEVWVKEALIRDAMVGCGFSEVIAYTLTSRERLGRLLPETGRVAGAETYMAPVGAVAAQPENPLARAIADRLAPLNVEPVEILNPLSSDLECMRTTAFGSLLETLSSNLRHADRDVFLFEVGRIYLPREADLPEERPVLTAVTGAYRSGRRWGSREEVDFFDVKGVAETLLARLRVPNVVYRPVAHPIFHPAKAAAIVLGPLASGAKPDPSRVVGVLGEVAEEVRRAFDVDERAFLLGLDLGRVLAAALPQPRYEPLPRYPAAIQDVAVVLDAAVPAETVEGTIRRAGQPLVRQVELFDIYQGEPIPAGRRSLAYHVVYQAPDRTLTDREVAEVHHRIEQALVGELGAQLRG